MIRGLLKLLVLLLACVVVFVFVEGLCSTILFVHHFAAPSGRWLAFPYQTRYDPELGWINNPNFYIKDYYNPGVYVKTNSKGFRSVEEFEANVPVGKVRIICSGDSFTFGVGVDNDHTWCQQLGSLDHRLQMINMGVSGYGTDQVYLWHQREGARLDRNVQILAVITEDFSRMQSSGFLGYGKPMVELQGDRLVETHVPVHKQSKFATWLSLNREVLSELRSVTLLQSIAKRFPHTSPQAPRLPPAATREVVAKIIDALQVTNQQKNSVLVVLYLPTRDDYSDRKKSAAWRDFLRNEAAERGVVFIDLGDDAQSLATTEVDKLFIQPRSQYYATSPGHYTDHGNEYFAGKIYKALMDNREVAAKLSGGR